MNDKRIDQVSGREADVFTPPEDAVGEDDFLLALDRYIGEHPGMFREALATARREQYNPGDPLHLIEAARHTALAGPGLGTEPSPAAVLAYHQGIIDLVIEALDLSMPDDGATIARLMGIDPDTIGLPPDQAGKVDFAFAPSSKDLVIDRDAVIAVAHGLRSEEGENSEYDRALVEMAAYLLGVGPRDNDEWAELSKEILDRS